jgi:hypothetical protein
MSLKVYFSLLFSFLCLWFRPFEILILFYPTFWFSSVNLIEATQFSHTNRCETFFYFIYLVFQKRKTNCFNQFDRYRLSHLLLKLTSKEFKEKKRGKSLQCCQNPSSLNKKKYFISFKRSKSNTNWGFLTFYLVELMYYKFIWYIQEKFHFRTFSKIKRT